MMQITIDTSQPLSDTERLVLGLLLGKSPANRVIEEPAEKSAAKPATRPARKPAAKPEPEVVEESPDEDDDLLGEEEVTKEMLVARVSELVAGGHGKAVKAILTEMGAAKVSLLSEDKYPAVFAKLQDI